MTNLDDLEKLHNLKKKGIISQEEFDKQKNAILNVSTSSYGNQKSQVSYCILALFLGGLGIHNFYVGRWKRGLAQLLLLLLSPITFFITAIISNLWSIINIFSIHTDGQGKEFEPSPTAKCVCGILGCLWFFLGILGIFSVAGISGYTMAMRRYRSNETLNYASMVSVLASSTDRIQGSVPCEDLQSETPSILNSVVCTAYPNGRVVFSGIDTNLKEDLLQRGMKQDSYGNLYFDPHF